MKNNLSISQNLFLILSLFLFLPQVINSQGDPFVLQYELTPIEGKVKEGYSYYETVNHYVFDAYSETSFTNKEMDLFWIQSNSIKEIHYKNFNNDRYYFEMKGDGFFKKFFEEADIKEKIKFEDQRVKGIVKDKVSRNLGGLQCYKNQINFADHSDTLWTTEDIQVDFPFYNFLNSTPVLGEIEMEGVKYKIELMDGEVLEKEPRIEFSLPIVPIINVPPQSNLRFSYDGTGLYIHGIVENEFILKLFSQMNIEIIKDGIHYFNIKTDDKGKYHIELPVGSIYRIVYGNDSTIKKIVEIDLSNLELGSAHELLITNVDVKLFKPRAAEDVTFLKEPIGYAFYNPSTQHISFDYKKSKSTQKKLDEIIEKR